MSIFLEDTINEKYYKNDEYIKTVSVIVSICTVVLAFFDQIDIRYFPILVLIEIVVIVFGQYRFGNVIGMSDKKIALYDGIKLFVHERSPKRVFNINDIKYINVDKYSAMNIIKFSRGNMDIIYIYFHNNSMLKVYSLKQEFKYLLENLEKKGIPLKYS